MALKTTTLYVKALTRTLKSLGQSNKFMTDWTSSFTLDQSLTCQQAAVPFWKTETQAGSSWFQSEIT